MTLMTNAIDPTDTHLVQDLSSCAAMVGMGLAEVSAETAAETALKTITTIENLPINLQPININKDETSIILTIIITTTMANFNDNNQLSKQFSQQQL